MQQFPSAVLADLKKHLEEEKVHLLSRVRELTSQDPFSDPERTNDNAASDMEASEESNHDRVSALLDELKVQLTSIDTSLAHIADGTYGFCTVCGNMIDLDRLSVMPTATLCLTHEKELSAHKK